MKFLVPQPIKNSGKSISQIEEIDDEMSLEYTDKLSNIKLLHVKSKNIGYVELGNHVSDLHYSGNYSSFTCRSLIRWNGTYKF